ncbi:MAG TPA: VOC family protein [Solimonas sp.]
MSKQAMAPGSFGPVRQLGYVVEDLDRAVSAWSTQLGVGPWLFIRNIPLQCVYHGAPSQPLIDIALSYRDEVQIELIQQRNDAASPYRTALDAGRSGLHHTAFLCEHVEEQLARAAACGLQVVCDIQMPSGRYVYLQSAELGDLVYVELLEANEQMLGMFAQGIEAAKHWDGRQTPTVVDFAAMQQG